jgi:isopentenyl diphosphate isomerase/L-lactate dehydrogenase-like FMN-dependent dehydrogenase
MNELPPLYVGGMADGRREWIAADRQMMRVAEEPKFSTTFSARPIDDQKLTIKTQDYFEVNLRLQNAKGERCEYRFFVPRLEPG